MLRSLTVLWPSGGKGKSGNKVSTESRTEKMEQYRYLAPSLEHLTRERLDSTRDFFSCLVRSNLGSFLSLDVEKRSLHKMV